MSERLTNDQLLIPAFGLLRKAPFSALIAIATLTLLADFARELPELWHRVVAMGAATIIVQREVTRNLLHSVGRPGKRRPYGAMLVVGIVTGMLTAAGFAIFVLPGLYLFARWSLSNVVLISEGGSPFGAMGASWARTQPHLPVISVALVLSFLPPFAVGVVVASVSNRAGLTIAPVISDVAGYSGLVLIWYLAVATYVVLQPVDEELAQIFA